LASSIILGSSTAGVAAERSLGVSILEAASSIGALSSSKFYGSGDLSS